MQPDQRGAGDGRASFTLEAEPFDVLWVKETAERRSGMGEFAGIGEPQDVDAAQAEPSRGLRRRERAGDIDHVGSSFLVMGEPV